MEDLAPLTDLSTSADEHVNEIAKPLPSDVVLFESTHGKPPPAAGTALDVLNNVSCTALGNNPESPLPLDIDLPLSPASSVTVLDLDFNVDSPTHEHTHMFNSSFQYCGIANALATEELTFVERDAEDSPSASISLGDVLKQPTSKTTPDSDGVLSGTIRPKRISNKSTQVSRPPSSSGKLTKGSTLRPLAPTREISRSIGMSLGPKKASGKSQARSNISPTSSSAKPSRSTGHCAPQKAQQRKSIANRNSPLDIAIAVTVNNLGSDVQKTIRSVSWEDKSGMYMIGDQNPRMYLLRCLRDQTVMVRVGGGWMELAR